MTLHSTGEPLSTSYGDRTFQMTRCAVFLNRRERGKGGQAGVFKRAWGQELGVLALGTASY